MCVERLSYVFVWERNPSAVSLKMPYDSAVWVEISPGLRAPIVSLPALLQMKRDAGRPRDLEDINELTRGRDNQE